VEDVEPNERKRSPDAIGSQEVLACGSKWEDAKEGHARFTCPEAKLVHREGIASIGYQNPSTHKKQTNAPVIAAEPKSSRKNNPQGMEEE